jgi:hypothetical protein
MQTKYIILIAVFVVVIIGLAVGFGMRGQIYGGNVGVVEINQSYHTENQLPRWHCCRIARDL